MEASLLHISPEPVHPAQLGLHGCLLETCPPLELRARPLGSGLLAPGAVKWPRRGSRSCPCRTEREEASAGRQVWPWSCGVILEGDMPGGKAVLQLAFHASELGFSQVENSLNPEACGQETMW